MGFDEFLVTILLAASVTNKSIKNLFIHVFYKQLFIISFIKKNPQLNNPKTTLGSRAPASLQLSVCTVKSRQE